MVVTPSTRRRQPQQSARDDVDSVVEHVMQVVHEPSAERQETHRRERPFVVAEFQLIRRELLDHKAIKRQVVVQRADDVIAVRPRPRKFLFLEEDVAFRVRIPSHVQPVPPQRSP